MHVPKDERESERARRRTAFDEFLALQLRLLVRRQLLRRDPLLLPTSRGVLFSFPSTPKNIFPREECVVFFFTFHISHFFSHFVIATT